MLNRCCPAFSSLCDSVRHFSGFANFRVAICFVIFMVLHLTGLTLSYPLVSNAVNRGDDGSGEIDIKSLVEPIAIILIVIGIVLFIIAFLGACGACCNTSIILAVVSLQSTYCCYAADLIGHITRFARPPVCPSVPYGLLTRKRKKY